MMRRVVMGLLCMALSSCSCGEEVVNKERGALITVTPSALDYGDVPLLARVTRSVTVVNLGAEPLTIEEAHVSDEAFALVTPLPELMPGEQLTLAVIFEPRALRRYSGVLTLVSNADSNRETAVSLSGDGVEPSFCGDCNDPPPPRCLTEINLAIDDPTGMCVDGMCAYTTRVDACEAGCDPVAARCRAPSCTDRDGGVVADSGPAPDAAVPIMDAGQPDAWMPEPDAGSSEPDAGTPDAGSCGQCNIDISVECTPGPGEFGRYTIVVNNADDGVLRRTIGGMGPYDNFCALEINNGPIYVAQGTIEASYHLGDCVPQRCDPNNTCTASLSYDCSR